MCFRTIRLFRIVQVISKDRLQYLVSHNQNNLALVRGWVLDIVGTVADLGILGKVVHRDTWGKVQVSVVRVDKGDTEDK